MMLALLSALTLGVVLLPLLPGLREWRRPTDVAPLRIEDDDALDPACFAHRFAKKLQRAFDAGDATLGRSVIVRAGALATGWPLSADEAAAGATRRIWCVDDGAELPPGMCFLAEVAAAGDLGTAPRGRYLALLADGCLRLAPRSLVLRWAHARDVEIGSGCRVAGRVSAERSISVGISVRFAMLHAPEIRFVTPQNTRAAPHLSTVTGVMHAGLPRSVRIEAPSGRAVADQTLRIEARHAWRGDLVCSGDLVLGDGCFALGSLKARGTLSLGAGCHVAGNLFARGEIHLGAGCIVQGCVASDTVVRLDSGCVVGTLTQPATVAAPRIDVAPTVRVHGTVWADDRGRARRDAVAAKLLRTNSQRAEPAALKGVA